MRIDAHHHLWHPRRSDYGWPMSASPLCQPFGPSDLEPLLCWAEIDGTILVQSAPTEAETRFLLDIADRTAWVLGVVGWIDLDAPDAPERVAALARHAKFVGIQPMLQNIDDPRWILGASRRRAIDAVAEQGVVFDALVRHAQLQPIIELAQRGACQGSCRSFYAASAD